MAQAFEQDHDFSRAHEMYERAEKVASGYPTGFHPEDLPWLRVQIARCRGAEQALADVEFAFQQSPEQILGLCDLRVRALLHRKELAVAVATAERFAAWAENLEQNRNDQRYNAACAFALCAAGSEQNREPLIARVLALLRQAKAEGYFDEQKLAHIKQDKDFAGLAGRDDFQKLLAELTTQSQPESSVP